MAMPKRGESRTVNVRGQNVTQYWSGNAWSSTKKPKTSSPTIERTPSNQAGPNLGQQGPAAPSSTSRGAFGGLTTEGFSDFQGEAPQIKRSSSSRGGYTAAPVTPARPVGTGAPTTPPGIERARPQPKPAARPRPTTPAPNGIGYTPGARSSYSLQFIGAPAGMSPAYGASPTFKGMSGRVVYPNDPAAAEAYDNVQRVLREDPNFANNEEEIERRANDAARRAASPTISRFTAVPGNGAGAFGGAFDVDTGAVGQRQAQASAMPQDGEQYTDPTTGQVMVRRGNEWVTTSSLNEASIARKRNPTRSDYVPPTESRFESTPGFDQAALQAAYVNQQRGDIQKEYTGNLARIREEMAARGLSQAGVSGAEQTAIVQNEIARSNALGRSRADATARSMELGRTDAIDRARNVDAYALSRGGFGLNYAQDNRTGNREDAMLGLDVAGKQIANQGGQIANDTANDANYENDQSRADRLAYTREQATAAALRNEATRFEIDQAVQTAPIVRQQAEAQLREIEQRIKTATQAQDWKTVDELGKIAGRVAKAGGFKIAGGILGGLVGSIIPGAGTVVGAGVGTAIGTFADGALGG